MEKFDGFVRASGDQLVSADGKPLVPRGVGLGNWLLPEGYMWGFGDHAASPRQIEGLITDLVGPEHASDFWRRYHEIYIAEPDIARIAAEGLDHVRVPINARVVMDEAGEFNPDGIALLDRLISWCRTHGMWVLLDLHGAPGGQTGTNIDDSAGQPDLFLHPHHQERTVHLWRMLAARYRDDTAVLGYDLLNEPLPGDWQDRFTPDLVALYRRLTAAIREVDGNHLIMYEGTHWATNWAMFTQRWDDNAVLQFHKYWSAPDRGSIKPYLDARDRLDIPIYMGEGGENNLDWIAAAFTLYDDHDIGWNFWPWKKLATATSPASITPPGDWDEIVAYSAGQADRPETAHCRDILDELLANCELAACTYRAEVINALLRRAPVELPSYAFTSRGHTRLAPPARVADPATGLRAHGLRDDETSALQVWDEPARPTIDYDQTRGEAQPADIVLSLRPGDYVEYLATLPRPGTVDVRIQLRGPGLPVVTVNGAAAVPTSRSGSTVVLTGPATGDGPVVIRIVAQDDEVVVRSVAIAGTRQDAMPARAGGPHG